VDFNSFSVAETSRNLTGIHNLDAILGELGVGITSVKAAAGVGKSALAIQIGTDFSGSTVYLDNEMNASDVFRRVSARTSKLNLNDLFKGSVSPVEVENINSRTKNALSKWHYLAGSDVFVSNEMIRSELDKSKLEKPNDKILLIIDGIDAWISRAHKTLGGTVQEIQDKLIRDIVDIVADYNIPVFVTCHKNTNILDYQSNSVFSLENERDGKTDQEGVRKVKAQFIKNRNGNNGFTILKFHPAYQDYAS
jgi:predicted ATP-dependent serine protease